jgi:hypothetical protein
MKKHNNSGPTGRYVPKEIIFRRSKINVAFNSIIILQETYIMEIISAG